MKAAEQSTVVSQHITGNLVSMKILLARSALPQEFRKIKSISFTLAFARRTIVLGEMTHPCPSESVNPSVVCPPSSLKLVPCPQKCYICAVDNLCRIVSGVGLDKRSVNLQSFRIIFDSY